jgi:hypothetical protein
MNASASPLSAEHCKCLDQILAATPMALEVAQKCTDCGLDMSDQIAALKSQQETAAKLKATFFPYQP